MAIGSMTGLGHGDYLKQHRSAGTSPGGIEDSAVWEMDDRNSKNLGDIVPSG